MGGLGEVEGNVRLQVRKPGFNQHVSCQPFSCHASWGCEPVTKEESPPSPPPSPPSRIQIPSSSWLVQCTRKPFARPRNGCDFAKSVYNRIRARSGNFFPYAPIFHVLNTPQLQPPKLTVFPSQTATQFLFHRYVNAITDLNFDLALSLAEALVDHAREALYSVPYKDVPLDFRVLYESASLTKTYGILRKWAHLLKGVERDTVEAAKETLTCMREALKALDLALLMSGCPNHKPLVLSLISEIESQISKAHTHLPEPPSQPPSLQPHQSTDHPPITHPIPRLTTPPSLTAFNTHILHSPTPLILQNLITTWPALTTNPWQNTSYLRRLAGSDRTVPVEIGKSYTDDSWSQKLMTFGEFIDQFLTNGDPEEIGYLAQHDLFSQIPQLRNDIITPDYCYVDLPGSESDDVITNAWVGPRGTVSPLHTDPHHNLFAQVVGAKYFRLVTVALKSE